MKDAKKIFWEKGTCSLTFCYIINREFGNNDNIEEKAADPMCGGILLNGKQCGMLWGASLGAGKEAHRRDLGERGAIITSKEIIKSFENKTGSSNCKDFTKCNFYNPFSLAKYMVFDARKCFNLCEEWADDAVNATKQGLKKAKEEAKSINSGKCNYKPKTCTGILAKNLNRTEEEIIMASSFAGGLGLSGNGCGALAAVIWIKHLDWCKTNPRKNPSIFNNKLGRKIIKDFLKETNEEFECLKITNMKFKDFDDHCKFIKEGGCKDIIELLCKK